MDKPTCKEIWDEDYELVHRESDASWRHGTNEYQVFHREEDNTYWAASFQLSTDGETNGLREGYADIEQVWPVEVKKIEYTRTNPSIR